MQKILGFIMRLFRYRNKQTVLALYRPMERPLLGKGAKFWSPIRWVDLESLKKVQRYQKRLTNLCLLIENFKILRGFRGVDSASVFELSMNRTRNHKYTLLPPRFNTLLYRDFSMDTVCNLWNSLLISFHSNSLFFALQKQRCILIFLFILIRSSLSPKSIRQAILMQLSTDV